MASRTITFLFITVCLFTCCYALPAAAPDGMSVPVAKFRMIQTTALDEGSAQRNCSIDPPYEPDTVKNTTKRISDLREVMILNDVHAYIIPTDDWHNACYKRRKWISGFSGLSGLAIVTLSQSALWTGGIYYLQAEQQLDCNWELMRSSESETESAWEWLVRVLPAGNETEPIKVAFDPTLLSISTYNSYADAFGEAEKAANPKYIKMESIQDNLVDKVWTDQQPCTSNPLIIMQTKWAGVDWWDKVTDIRSSMSSANVDMMVLHALDDTAWFFNLRGSDVGNPAVFFSYTIIRNDSTTLYIKNTSALLTDDIKEHLQLNSNETFCGNETTDNKCLEVREYDGFQDELRNETDLDAIQKVWISTTASFAIYGNVPEKKQYEEEIPIQAMKAVKNANETEGMKEGYRQDAVAMIEFLHWIEGAVVDAKENKINLTEISAGDKVEEFRRKQEDFVTPSFAPISGFGPHGAVIHYRSTEETNVDITDDDLYVLDSGGQYTCGATTDITRTMHFGDPKDKHKEAYTRVLMGAIDLSLAIFPEGTSGSLIDVHARKHLWANGWNYLHGTGHGIGAMLNVHEGPQYIDSVNTVPLEPNVFLSDEPGYYEDNDYGVRLETVFMVVKANTPNNFGGKEYYTFEEVALVPFHPKLIKYEIMSPQQIEWLNDYNQRIREIIGPRINSTTVHEWMMERTEPYSAPVPSDPSPTVPPVDESPLTASNVVILAFLVMLTMANIGI